MSKATWLTFTDILDMLYLGSHEYLLIHPWTPVKIHGYLYNIQGYLVDINSYLFKLQVYLANIHGYQDNIHGYL